TPAQVVGKSVFDYFSEPHASEYHADDMRVVERGEALVNKEEPLPSADGHTVWVTTTKVPLKDADGKVSGIVGLRRDITERRAAQEADRKSTRLNSSHEWISYAVFCLK